MSFDIVAAAAIAVCALLHDHGMPGDALADEYMQGTSKSRHIIRAPDEAWNHALLQRTWLASSWKVTMFFSMATDL